VSVSDAEADCAACAEDAAIANATAAATVVRCSVLVELTVM
jgi:hypothetical protein